MTTFDLRQFGNWLDLEYDGKYLYVTTKKYLIQYDGKYCYKMDKYIESWLSINKYYKIWHNAGQLYFYNFPTKQDELILNFYNLFPNNYSDYHVIIRTKGNTLYYWVHLVDDLILFKIPIKNRHTSQIIRIDYQDILRPAGYNYISDVICHIGNYIIYVIKLDQECEVYVYDKIKKTTNNKKINRIWTYVYDNHFLYVLSINGIMKIGTNLNCTTRFGSMKLDRMEIAYNKYLIGWKDREYLYRIFDTHFQVISEHKKYIHNVNSNYILLLYGDKCVIHKIPQKIKIDILKKIINNNYKHISRLIIS